MAHYRVKEPSLEKLDELARLSFNVRYHSINFKANLGSEYHRLKEDAERDLDKFIKENIEKITETEK